MEPGLGMLCRLMLAIGVSGVLSLIVGRRLLRLDVLGSGVIGGVCAGFALGPAMFGAALPSVHEQIMVGGVLREAEAAAVRARIEPERRALLESGVSEIAAAEHGAGLAHEASGLEDTAAMERELARRLAAALSAAGALLSGLAFSRWGPGRPGSFGAGVVSSLLAGLVWSAAARVALGVGLGEACVFGAAMCGCGLALRGGPASRSWQLGGAAVASIVLAWFAGIWTGAMLALLIGVGLLLRSLQKPFDSSAFGRPAGGGGFPAGGGRFPAIAARIVVPTSIALIVPLAGQGLTAGGVALVVLAGVLAGDVHLVACWIASGSLGSESARARPLHAWAVRSLRAGPAWRLLLVGLALAGGGFDSAGPEGSAIIYAACAASVVGAVMRPASMRIVRSL
ncbi:MAG: hypothetical protein AAFR96_04690 [Planctomycetota bacterium]